jgi:hypothetical protein
MGSFTDDKFIRADIDPSIAQLVNLFDQNRRIHHHPVSNHTLLLLQDSGRNQMADKLLITDNQGVAGIVSALKTNHHIGKFSQKIYDFAFAFISPLGSYDDYICHD